MAVAFYLLIIAGTLGAFDMAYFHIYTSRLAQRPERDSFDEEGVLPPIDRLRATVILDAQLN